MKKLILTSALFASALLVDAQQVSNVDFEVDGYRINVTYDLSRPANNVALLFNDGTGNWTVLENVIGNVGNDTQAGSNAIGWNVLADYPGGIEGPVQFCVMPEYRTPSLENVPYKQVSGYLSASQGVLWGHKAYFARKINERSGYGGDLRKGTAATATDNVSFESQVLEYDFITGKWRDLGITKKFSARVPRKTHNGLFPMPRIPDYNLYIDRDGNLCFESNIVAYRIK